MRKRTGILGLAAVILLALVTVTLLRRPPDPVYDGKRLSAWLDIYGQGYGAAINLGPAEDAIRHIGTNGLPLLLDLIAYAPPMTRYPLCKRLPNWILLSRPVWSVLANPKATTRAEAAQRAFAVLGEATAPAIPELIRRAAVKRPSAHRDNALMALAAALANFKDPPIPALAAAGTAADTEAMIPALACALTNQHPDVRGSAAIGLRVCGDAARPALPALLKAMADPVAPVRFLATNAVLKIAPEALTNAPPQ